MADEMIKNGVRVAAIHGGRNQNLLDKDDAPVFCRRCKLQMVPEQTFFDYIGHNFHTDLMRCPKCGAQCLPKRGGWLSRLLGL